jgi:lipopolysaccharide export system protein LptA
MVPEFFKKIDSWFFLIVMLGFIYIGPGLVTAGAAESSPPVAGSLIDKEQELVITADRLEADVNENYSEFSGNVKAVQGDTVITADRLRIFFKSSSNRSGQLSVGEDAVEKITARGNVTIKAADMTAVTSEASYINESRLLVLTGPDSTVKSGQNSIVGAKITLDRASGRVTVENSVEKQVKALFFTNGKGLN